MLDIFKFFTESDTGWLSLITGSGGALVILMMWVRDATKQVKQKDKELTEISRESVECITRIIDKLEREDSWKKRIEKMVRETNRHIITEKKAKEIIERMDDEEA